MGDTRLYINKINEYFKENSFDVIGVAGFVFLSELIEYLTKLKF